MPWMPDTRITTKLVISSSKEDKDIIFGLSFSRLKEEISLNSTTGLLNNLEKAQPIDKHSNSSILHR